MKCKILQSKVPGPFLMLVRILDFTESWVNLIILVIKEFDVSLSSRFPDGSQIFRFLWPVTRVFQSKSNWGEVQSCLVRCELILLGMIEFPFVLYLVRTVRKLDSSLVTYWTTKKLEQEKVIERVYVFSASFARKYQYYHRAVKSTALLATISTISYIVKRVQDKITTNSK
jgi:hypothetical protein